MSKLFDDLLNVCICNLRKCAVNNVLDSHLASVCITMSTGRLRRLKFPLCGGSRPLYPSKRHCRCSPHANRTPPISRTWSPKSSVITFMWSWLVSTAREACGFSVSPFLRFSAPRQSRAKEADSDPISPHKIIPQLPTGWWIGETENLRCPGDAVSKGLETLLAQLKTFVSLSPKSS